MLVQIYQSSYDTGSNISVYNKNNYLSKNSDKSNYFYPSGCDK